MSTIKVNNVQVGLSLTSTNNFTWYQPAVVDGTVRLGNGNAGATSSDVMTITSAGNVGIGTSSPSYKLHAVGATNGAITLGATNSTAGTSAVARFIAIADGGNATFGMTSSAYTDITGAADALLLNSGGASGGMVFALDGVSAMKLDSSGNLGLGVTPSAWGNTYKVIQVGANGALWSLASGIGATFFSNNEYFDGTNFRYLNTGAASHTYQSGGAFYWSTAPSGTAGNAISFTQAMTLDASGNLGIGTSSPNASLVVSKQSTELSGTGNSYGVYIYPTSSGACWIDAATASTSNTDIGIRSYNNGTYNFMIQSLSGGTVTRFGTDGQERMRITSGGEVYIAGTTDQGAYNLQCNGTGVWGAGAYVNGSDAALKENVQDLPAALDVVKAIRPVTFTYKEDYSKDRTVQTGFIAQELQQALADQPYLDGIVQAGPEHLNVAYQSLIPLLVKSIQEQQELINQLTARVAQLEK